MSKKSKSADRKPDDFEDDFDYEGNASQPYAGQRVAGNDFMNNKRTNDRGGDGNYPMVVLPNNRTYGNPAQNNNNYENNYDDIAQQEEEMKIQKRKKRTYRAVKIFGIILLVFALLGFFVPAYISIPSASVLVMGESVVGASMGSPFSVFLGSLSGFPSSVLTKEALYAWWQLFCVVMILVCAIATLFTKKASVVWFSFECLFGVVSIFGYFAFLTPTQILVIDFFVIAALIGIVAFLMQAFSIGKSGAVIPLICLIAMIVVMVFTREDTIISVTASAYTFAGIILRGSALPELYLFLADIAAMLLIINILLTILQLCTFRRTTWFSFIRYTVMALVAIVALILATIATGKSVFELLYLPIFTVVALVLALLCLIACLHNRKVLARERARKAQAEQEEVVPQEEPPVAAPQPPAAPYTVVPGSNVYININPQGTSFATPVPIMQYAADPYTTKKVYSDGFVGTINRVPHNIDEHTGIRTDEYNPPFSYMGESCANVKASTQGILPNRTAPILSEEDLETVMATSSMDTVLPPPEPEERVDSNIEYIAEEGEDPVPDAETTESVYEEPIVEIPAETTEETVEEPTEEVEETEETPAEGAAEEITEIEVPETTEESEEVAEEPVPEEVSEEVAEADEGEEAEVTSPEEEPAPEIEKIEEPVPEEIIDEDAETPAEEVPAEEPEEEEEEEEIEDDAFLQSLTKKDRKEFRATFLGENSFDYLPAYDIGGDNSAFFDAIFIYLTKIRESVSESLLAAMYTYMNS
jgi:hypothetical protein